MSAAGQVGGELTNDQFVKLLCSGKPVHLRDCIIKGQVDLSYGRFTSRIVCESCTFDSPLLAVEAHFERSISLSQSKFKGGIDWTAAHIEGGLKLSGSHIGVAEPLTGTERWPANIIALATPSQRAGLGRMTIRGPVEMDEAVIDGTLDLEGTTVEGSLCLWGAEIAGRLNARSSVIQGECDLNALQPRSTKDGSLSAFKQTRIGGDCIFSSAKLGGHVTLSGAFIEGHLRFTSSHISGWLIMREAVWSDESSTRVTSLLPQVGRPLKNGAGFWRGALNLSYATVEGTIDLSGAELHGSLRLDYTKVEQDIKLYAAVLGQGPLNDTLRPCRILGVKDFSINATALQVGGSLDAYSIYCEGGICLNGARITHALTISGTLPRDAINGEEYYAAHVGTDGRGFSLLGESLWVGGGISLNGLDGAGIVSFNNARIHGTFSIAPLYGYSGKVHEDASCTRLRGGLVLDGCEISSHANLRLARIYAPEAVPEGFMCPGLRMWRTRVFGQMSASGFLLRGTLVAEGAEIGDALDLSGAVVTGDVQIADAKLGTSLVFGNEPEEGDSQLAELGTWIGGRLIASKLIVTTGFYLWRGSIGDKIAAEDAADLAERGLTERRGKLPLQSAIPEADHSTKPAVELVGARVGGDLIIGRDLSYTPNVLNIGVFWTLAGHLDGRALYVGGQCKLAGVKLCGDLNLPESQIGGGFELIHSSVSGDLDMSGAEVKGEIFRRSRFEVAGIAEEVSPIVKGRVLLSRAKIRVLRLHFVVPNTGAEAAVTVPTSVDLDHAEIGKLIVSGELRATTPPKFRFSGLRFDEIVVNNLQPVDSRNQFVRLLDQMDHAEFNQGVYLQVEKWLRDRGKDKEADGVYLALRFRELDVERRSVWRLQRLRNPGKWFSDLFLWLGRSLLYYTVADGVRVMRLFWLWVLALVCSILLFSRRESVQHPSGFAAKSEYEEVITAKGLTPSKWAAKTRVFWTEEMGEPESWRWTDGMWVALRVHVPLVELFARSDWVPSQRRIQPIPLFYETYASYMRLFSVIALPLMVTAATGVLKRK